MGVFGVVFGCIGDAGFTLVCISGCRGVVGFNVVTSQLPVREKVRPACEKWPKIVGLWRAGRTFLRKSRWMGCAGRVVCDNTAGCGVLGEFFRGCVGEGSCRANFVAPTGTRSHFPEPSVPSSPAVPVVTHCATVFKRASVGVLHYMKPSGCVSPACRSLM